MKATSAEIDATAVARTASSLDVPGTKFAIPQTRPRLVHRDRLTARLDADARARLTLFSAPAGYGKTTVLVDWVRNRSSDAEPALSVAWIALDDSDNDPVRFLRVLAGALRVAAPAATDITSAVLGEPGAPASRTVLIGLVNEVLAVRHPILLVLEDYHVIRDQRVHDAVAFLLEKSPPGVHLAITTREDPPLPLAQLRAGGCLCEIRAADLCFTQEEAAIFLNATMKVPATAAEAAALGARTEGWVAGLQLAALSMRGAASSGFRAFGGTHRDVRDYLGADVLAGLPPALRTFLLRTSVLDRLSAPVCEALLPEPPEGGAQAMLERVERANLFLVALDAERRWYRYHRLFAEFLRAQLEHTEPGILPDLHARASGWYERQGFIREAIAHSIAGGGFDNAARLIERHHMLFLLDGRLRTLSELYRGLPADLVLARPLLSVAYAYALYLENQPAAAATYLGAAEEHLLRGLPGDEAELVRGRISVLRAMMAGNAGNLAHAVASATEALKVLPAWDRIGRAWAQMQAGRAFRVDGNVTSASEQATIAAVEHAKAAGLPLATLWAMIELARLRAVQGRLHQAAALFREVESLVGWEFLRQARTYCFGVGDLLREWNDLDGARRLLTQGMESIEETRHLAAYVAEQGYVAIARTRQASGDADGAETALEELVRLARMREWTGLPASRIAAVRAHLSLMQGNLAAAIRWAETSGLGPDDEVGYARELEYLVFARVLITGKNQGALSLLDRLLDGAGASGRTGSAIEILAVRALARSALGQSTAALADLERALALGEPEGYVRVFVDEGAAMASLLRRAHSRGIAAQYVARLLAAFRKPPAGSAASRLPAPEAPRSVADRREIPTEFVEPLTAREREILGLLAAGASNQEIARRLYVTTGTVKGHVHHIISKLAVRSRTQAITRAQALRLV